MKMRRIAAAGVAALALALSCSASSAHAAVKLTHHVAYSPYYTSGDFNVLLPKVGVPAPHVDGYVTHMYATLVDEHDRAVPLREVMLHHLVFINDGDEYAPDKGSCKGRHGEPFWGTGEEHQALQLPPGYGYHVHASDHWRMQVMLMSHDVRLHKVRVRYTYTYVTGAKLTEVTPFWIRANGCNDVNPSYTVNASDHPGATQTKTWKWKVPFTGRIVAAGGHLHGGADNMTLTQPRCGNRQLLNTQPLYGRPDDTVYSIRPILHEPGPINTNYFYSRDGIAIRKGETLKLNGIYDATHPRARVMAIMHVYVAKDPSALKATTHCAPLPPDRKELAMKYSGGTRTPPYEPIPLSAVTDDGTPYTLDGPLTGPTFDAPGNVLTSLKQFAFTTPNISIPVGGKVTWAFDDGSAHNILFASGPKVVGAPTLSHGARYTQTFTAPGTYKLFCYLHPVTMHQIVTVRPS